MEFIEALDLGSLFGIASFQQQTPWLIPVFKVVAAAGSLWVLAIVTVLAFFGLTVYGRWRSGLLVVITFLATAAICQAVQPLVARPLPDVKEVASGRPYGFGFPNGPAALSSATFAIVLLSLLPLMRSRFLQGLASLAVVVLVLAIGFSPMYLAWGYLSDTVGGWALGLGLALLFHWLDLRWSRPEIREEMAA
jgi:membrane-associated phospholipid phosphatase